MIALNIKHYNIHAYVCGYVATYVYIAMCILQTHCLIYNGYIAIYNGCDVSKGYNMSIVYYGYMSSTSANITFGQ